MSGRATRLGASERALGILALGLLAVSALALVLPSGGTVEPARFRLASPAHVDAGEAGRDAGPAAETALARPLFAPDRRPVAVAVGPIEVPRLAGVIAGRDAPPKAIFAADGDAKPPVLGVGGRIGGHVIRAIGANSVTLDDGSVLHPSFADAGDAGSDNAAQATGGSVPGPGMGGGPMAMSVNDLIRQSVAARRGAPPPR